MSVSPERLDIDSGAEAGPLESEAHMRPLRWKWERSDCFEATGRCAAALHPGYSADEPLEGTMARFLINRVWEPMDEAELQKMAGVSKRLIDEQFTDSCGSTHMSLRTTRA